MITQKIVVAKTTQTKASKSFFMSFLFRNESGMLAK
jgi:hypothetical protein